MHNLCIALFAEEMFADTAFTLSARNSGPDSDNQILHAQFSLRSYAVIAFHLAGCWDAE